MSTQQSWLEYATQRAWRRWAAGNLRNASCDSCETVTWVGKPPRARRWLCVECWDRTH